MLIDRILEAWTENRQFIVTKQEDEAIRSKLKAARIEPFVWESSNLVSAMVG